MTLPTMALQPGAIKLFFSYANEDEQLCADLFAHLSPLRREGIIDEWHHLRMAAGIEIEREIERNLASADIILLLISANFFNSDRCWRNSIQAMERCSSEEATVIPVILRPVDWRQASFGHLAELPRDGKPITAWGDKDEALLSVAVGVREVVAGKMSPALVRDVRGNQRGLSRLPEGLPGNMYAAHEVAERIKSCGDPDHHDVRAISGQLKPS